MQTRNSKLDLEKIAKHKQYLDSMIGLIFMSNEKEFMKVTDFQYAFYSAKQTKMYADSDLKTLCQNFKDGIRHLMLTNGKLGFYFEITLPFCANIMTNWNENDDSIYRQLFNRVKLSPLFNNVAIGSQTLNKNVVTLEVIYTNDDFLEPKID